MIKFINLHQSHFQFLLKWLETPHVKQYWDQDIIWNEELIRQKYEAYVKGYKILRCKNGKIIKKIINGFIIIYQETPIGYIQYYDKHDFPSHNMSDIPRPCAGLDWYIGEVDFIGMGIGSKVLKLFVSMIPEKFTNIIVEPEINNIAAIKTYDKAGFIKIANQIEKGVIFMIKSR